MASEVITLTRRDDLQSSNAKFRSRSHDAVIRVYDESGNVIEMPSTRAISRVVSLARITSQFPLNEVP